MHRSVLGVRGHGFIDAGPVKGRFVLDVRVVPAFVVSACTSWWGWSLFWVWFKTACDVVAAVINLDFANWTFFLDWKLMNHFFWNFSRHVNNLDRRLFLLLIIDFINRYIIVSLKRAFSFWYALEGFIFVYDFWFGLFCHTCVVWLERVVYCSCLEGRLILSWAWLQVVQVSKIAWLLLGCLILKYFTLGSWFENGHGGTDFFF